MDAKITLSFNREIIGKAKAFAESNNISLSRLTEYLYTQIVGGNYQNLEEMPIADWVKTVSEGEVEYKTKIKSRKKLKDEYYQSKK